MPGGHTARVRAITFVKQGQNAVFYAGLCYGCGLGSFKAREARCELTLVVIPACLRQAGEGSPTGM